jgi:hypothetical protein
LSRQAEAHGELGVTCNARTLCEKRRIVRREFMRAIAILKFRPEQTQVRKGLETPFDSFRYRPRRRGYSLSVPRKPNLSVLSLRRFVKVSSRRHSFLQIYKRKPVQYREITLEFVKKRQSLEICGVITDI